MTVFDNTFQDVSNTMNEEEFREILVLFKHEMLNIQAKIINNTETKAEIHKLKSGAGSIGAYKLTISCDQYLKDNTYSFLTHNISECLNEITEKFNI
jgi:HPt (histidine-containing phosphotransfer) domain-containing protein